MARGFSQKHDIDFEETFEPTIRLDAVRIILAIAARENWEVYQMDVVTAFLAGELDEEVYLKVPVGINVLTSLSNVSHRLVIVYYEYLLRFQSKRSRK